MKVFRKIQKRKCKIQMIRHISINPKDNVGRNKIYDGTNEENQQSSQKIIEDYCENTTVHGIRYFTGEQHHWIERAWWMGSFVLSVVLCVIAISSIWTTWSDHPVTVIFDDKRTSISDIPFPAVTICTSEKLDEQYLDENGTVPKNWSLYHMEAISELCLKNMKTFADGKTKFFGNVSIYESIEEMSPKGFADDAVFHHSPLNLFQPIFTEEGLCYTANSMNSHEIYTNAIAPVLLTVRDNPNTTHWNVENGYQTNNVSEDELYPYRVFRSNIANAMHIYATISAKYSFRICDTRFNPGFFLSLQMPDEIPRFDSSFVNIPAEHDAEISIKPKMVATSEGLRSYAPHKKGCFFKSERQLGFFKAYSEHKCEMECLANFTKQKCGCVRFWMPRDRDTKVCRYFDYDCYTEADDQFEGEKIVKQCDCLPDCTSIGYDMEYQLSDYRVSDKHYKYPISTIRLWFKEQHFIAINRTETNTISEFISSCGGLLGLFLGVSLLSIVECIYFFTLRLSCKLIRKKEVQSIVKHRGRNQFEFIH